jgi:hypothetical protein
MSPSHRIERYLSELRRYRFEELVQMRSHVAKDRENGKKRESVAVWIDRIDGDCVRIVVQLYQRWFLGVGRMYAVGFKMFDDGTTIPLNIEELYEFM